jgi:hypothetical protein
MPIDINQHKATKDVWTDLDDEIDLIWAEAVELYRNGEKLFLSENAEGLAKTEQIKHSEVDERKGLIEQFLDKKLPDDWNDKDLYERRAYLEDPISGGTVVRDYTCIAEIWCECLGKNKEDMSRYNTRDLNDIMRGLQDWEPSASTKNFSLYGKQKYYTRKLY